MKRTLLQRGAIIAACAAAFVFAACGDDPEFDARTDTVYSLETPSVSAKAYPGVNVVSWKPVTGASSYKVTVYEEGAFKKNVTYKDENSFTDTELVNGKTYTYSVEAVSTTNPGTITAREVYATNSRGEASVRAIVPPAGTKSLELPAYENGYDGTNTKTVPESEKQWIIESKNINAFQDGENIYVEFPMKAYLKYTVICYSNKYDEDIKNGTKKVSKSDINANNATGHTSFKIMEAGTYQIAVVANAYNESYYTASEEAQYGKLITIESLGLDETGTATAKYLSDGKTARISFEPAKKDGVYVLPSWYKVFRRVKGEYATADVPTDNIKENVSVEIKKENGEDKKYTKKTYYVDDAITNNKQVYEYIVVVEKDGKYGEKKTAPLNIVTDLSLDSQTDTVTAEYLYNVNHFATGADNTVRISFAPATKDGNPVPTDWYEVYRSEIIKYTEDKTTGKKIPTEISPVQIEITSDTNTIMLDNEDPKTYVIYDKSKDIDPAKGYIYTVVVKNDGNFKAETGQLAPKTKVALVLSEPSAIKVSDWNDYKWTFTANTADNDEAISGIKEIKAYIWVTPTTQANPKANEIIANGSEITVTRDTTSTSKIQYSYAFTKSALSTTSAKVSVVVMAKCDGYEDAVSAVTTTPITKPAE